MSDKMYTNLTIVVLVLVITWVVLAFAGLDQFFFAFFGGIWNFLLAIIGFFTSIWGIGIVVVVLKRHYSRNS